MSHFVSSRKMLRTDLLLDKAEDTALSGVRKAVHILEKLQDEVDEQ
jgi:hypothetical protein